MAWFDNPQSCLTTSVSAIEEKRFFESAIQRNASGSAKGLGKAYRRGKMANAQTTA